jgi:hypothetical protein
VQCLKITCCCRCCPSAEFRHGVAASHIAQALFWINLPSVCICIVLIPFSMFTIHDYGPQLTSMTAVWLLPVVPACVAANTAGIVAQNVQDATVGMIITSIGEPGAASDLSTVLPSRLAQSSAADQQQGASMAHGDIASAAYQLHSCRVSTGSYMPSTQLSVCSQSILHTLVVPTAGAAAALQVWCCSALGSCCLIRSQQSTTTG